MKRFWVSLMLFILCAAPLSAQAVADYNEKMSILYGTRNMSAQYDPTVPPSVPASTLQEMWAESIEDDRWIITAWMEAQIIGATQANISYRWRAYDKSTGYYTNYVSTANMVGNFADTGNSIGTPFTLTSTNNITLQQLRRYKPSLTFTTSDGSADAYAGVAVAIPDIDIFTNFLDVFVFSLRLDPATIAPMAPSGTQPEWIADFNRNPKNCSSSSGSVICPNIDGLPNGEIYVSWIDSTTVPTDSIGDVPNIIPQIPNPNPSGIGAADVYVRRMQSVFPGSAGFADGYEDSAVPGSTVNASTSQGFESDLDTCVNGAGDLYVSFTTISAETDTVAGLGANSGPKSGAFGAESSDLYLRSVTLNGTNTLTLAAATNVTSSTGACSANPNYVVYNASLGQIAILFYDNTRPNMGGIAGNSNLSAVEQGQAPNLMAQYDAFFRSFRNDLTPVNAVPVTQSALFEAAGDIASLNQNGFVVGYSVLSTSGMGDSSSFHARVDATGMLATTTQSPRQPQLQPGGIPQTLIYSITAWPPQSVSIIFNHGVINTANPPAPQEGVPEYLRVGGGPLGIEPERPSATGANDMFLMVGEPNSSNPAQGQIRIADFVVNDGNPIDPNAPPLNIPVDIVLENVSPSAALSLDQLQVSPPIGFTQIGQGPTLPFNIFPSGQASFTFDFDVDVSLLSSGSNEFSVSASGFIGGFATLSTKEATIAILGTEGTLVGVGVIAQFNPTVLTAGVAQEVEVTIAVTNGGQETLRDLEIEGGLATGFLPTNLRNTAFTPDPQQAEITAGDFQVFTSTVNVSTFLKENSADVDGYRPAVTVSGTQSSGLPGAGTRMGSVTIRSQVGIRIDALPESEKAAPPSLVNAGGPSGCALTTGESTSIVLLTILAAMMTLIVGRRIRAH